MKSQERVFFWENQTPFLREDTKKTHISPNFGIWMLSVLNKTQAKMSVSFGRKTVLESFTSYGDLKEKEIHSLCKMVFGCSKIFRLGNRQFLSLLFMEPAKSHWDALRRQLRNLLLLLLILRPKKKSSRASGTQG